MSLVFRQEPDEGRMRVGEHRGQAVQEPLHLDRAPEEHAAQHAADDALRVGLCVGQRQRRSPRAAEQQQAFQPEMAAQHLDVGHQVLGGVLLQAAERA